MKTLFKVAALTALVAAPIVSFAQQADTSQQSLTREQVRADLVAVEKAGYKPQDTYHYPDNIQRAERIVAAQNAGAAAYGNAAAANTQSGQ